MILAIFDNKDKAQTYADQIHTWLIKNRKDYRAEKWCDIELCKNEAGLQYYIKVPPDYEVLNEKIVKSEDKLQVSKDAIMTVSKLPDNWRTNE